MKRTIIFGDIHGCYLEWRDLIKKLKVTKSDHLISVGDIVCKGPSTKKALDLALSLPNLKCVRGNHEQHLLNAWHEERLHELSKEYQQEAVKELGKKIDTYMTYIKSWPYYIEEDDFIVIHGGIKPHTPLKKQNHHNLLYLRTLEDGTPWHDHYRGKKLVVYGHWAKQGLSVKKNTIGLDSGCVYGKKLSALVLPEKKIVQVDARDVYVEV